MVSSSTYDPSHSVQPYFVRVTKDAAQADFIIIDDIEYGGGQGSLLEEVSGSIVWLQIEINNKITQLLSPPNEVSGFSPSHSDLSQLRIYVKSSEVFVIHYTTTDMDDASDRDEVTGYQLGTSSDILYVKIDHAADKLTIHQ